jgi:hypothetical protein
MLHLVCVGERLEWAREHSQNVEFTPLVLFHDILNMFCLQGCILKMMAYIPLIKS